MFIKLVVLILVCGSSGVGLLSVRQSRLQAGHEMAEARHRCLRLEEQAGEIRSRIAQACTPERVVELLDAQMILADSAVNNRYEYDLGTQPWASNAQDTSSEPGPESEPDDVSLGAKEAVPSESMAIWVDESGSDREPWILNDGTRVIFIDE